MNFIPLEDIGLIGDRKTVAFVSKQGEICWHCPERYDADPIFASLLDPERGGHWRIKANENLQFCHRSYLADSAVLNSSYKSKTGNLEVTDFMPVNDGEQGIIRKVENSGIEAHFEIQFFRNQKERKILVSADKKSLTVDDEFFILSSEDLSLEKDKIIITFKEKGETWVYLTTHCTQLGVSHIDRLYKETIDYWANLQAHFEYEGPYKKTLKNSFLILRLLTHRESGAIIAAATTSLPEVIEGSRNYDYRFVWLRDTAMIVSAMVRAGDASDAPEKFLDFICDSHHKIKNSLLYPFFTIDKKIAPPKKNIEGLRGYFDSLPTVTGNEANEQLQLDANANVLIAAKLVYQRGEDRPHWEIVRKIANFLCEKWCEKDHGIWEESVKYQYTASKVIVASALEYIAKYNSDPTEKEYWKGTVKKIKKYIKENCISSEGYYKLAAEIDDVDVSAILFPIWGFVDAEDPVVLKTLEKLESDYMESNLFRRRLVCFDSNDEGAFLAGSIWVAQYYVMRKNFSRFEEIIDAVLKYSNDLGLLSEEADLDRKRMMGNIPQTFVHASLIGAVIDYKNALNLGDKL